MQSVMTLRNQKGITTFWGISIILMEAVVVFFVFYILYFFWIENPTPTSDILIIRTFNKRNVVDIPVSVDATGWLAYGSSVSNFSLRYPGDLTLTEDDIVYGTSEGNLIEFQRAGATVFSVRVFPLTEEEKNDSDTLIPDVFTRIISFDPSVYQSYMRQVDDVEAVVYRQVPGDSSQDFIYFMSADNFFEANFNQTAANILSTFQFTD